MRITDATKYRQVVSHMQTGQRGLQELQAQISSGKRLQTPSQDPNAASVILQTRNSLRGIQQFQRNIGVAISRLETEESVLGQLGDVLSRARELAVGQASDTATAETRQQTKSEVDSLLGFTARLGNTRFHDGYLFAGFQSQVAPLKEDGTLNPAVDPTLLDQPHEIEIAVGERVATNHNAKQLFLDTGAVEAISDLAAALGANDAEGVRAATGKLEDAFTEVQNFLGDIGGRYNHLQITESSLKTLDLSTTTLQSKVEDVDMTRALVDLASRQTTLQSAYMASSRILSLNLTDYLR